MEGLIRHSFDLPDDTQAVDDADLIAVTAAVHRVTVERVGIGRRGPRYAVTHLGAVIVPHSRDPEFDACRALQALGLTGTMETFSPGGRVARMRLDISAGAKLATSETAQIGPRLTRWQPFDRTMIGQDADRDHE